jgi:hypothetical protein
MREIGAVQFFHDPLVTGPADIQEQSKTHEIVSRSKTELWHRILTHDLPLYFPEAKRFHRSSRTDRFLAVLEKYPTPHIMTSMSREAFVAGAWQVAGRKSQKNACFQTFTQQRLALWACRLTQTPTPFVCSASCWPKAEAWCDSATRSRRGPSNSYPITRITNCSPPSPGSARSTP